MNRAEAIRLITATQRSADIEKLDHLEKLFLLIKLVEESTRNTMAKEGAVVASPKTTTEELVWSLS